MHRQETNSPKTPKSFMAKRMGSPLRKLSCSLKSPSVREDQQTEIVPETVPSITHESSSDFEEHVFYSPDFHLPSSNEEQQRDDLKNSLSVLTAAVTTLTAAITTKDPLEGLNKEREELMKVVLLIGGLTSTANFFMPPGGLDSDGHARFRFTLLYLMFFVCSEASFLISFGNVAMLHKALDENEDKVKQMRRRITRGWIMLWTAFIFFLAGFTIGFWIVYPTKKGVLKLVPYQSWPRWVSLGLAVFKVGFIVTYLFGRSIVTSITSLWQSWSGTEI